MKISRLFTNTTLTCTAMPVLAFVLSINAQAQVEISGAVTEPVVTSTAGDGDTPSDVTITGAGTITVTQGTAVTLDSDNTVINAGSIMSTDADNTTGVLISGVTGGFTNSGSITLAGSVPTDGIKPTGSITTGTGRTGILISGASPFTGNVTNEGSVTISGQDSAGIRLAAMSSITGNIFQNGPIGIFGEDSVGVDIAGKVIGNLAINGTMNVTGDGSQAVNISGDIDGGVSLNNVMSVTGYVNASGFSVSSRPALSIYTDLLENGNLGQAGSALQISSNITNGVHIGSNRNEDTNILISTGGINMIGSAPAVLIDGNGTPIAIGVVGQITDTNDEDYNAELQYAFVNQGTLISDGVLDDINATTFSLADATLNGGLNNSGTLRSTVYRSGIDPDATTPTHDSHARVIIIGGGGMAERINNTGAILARGFEASDAVYADRDNILGANTILATAIDILAGGSVPSIRNIGGISAIVTGRNGEAVAIRDASGTFITLDNHGSIGAFGASSDILGDEETNFNLIAIDVAANTTGFTLNQSVFTDPDTEVISTPSIVGDILLGSGADTLNIAGGTVSGDISFGDGADTLQISGGSVVTGGISDSDGALDIMITDGSSLIVNDPADFNVTTATIDSTSTYQPFINPESGEVSVMNASGTVTFEEGSTIAPQLGTVLQDTSTTFTIINAGTLVTGANFGNIRDENSPFMYNTTLTRDPNNDNTLILTLDLRDTSELGLDSVQTAAFTSAFEALQNSNALGEAFVGLTTESDFNSAYNQLLPEIASAARHFVMANVDGTSGAVGSHLRNVRLSQEKPGGLWIEQFAYYADKDISGLSDQFRGYGFGITGGIDTSFGPFHTAGLSFGFATTEIEDVLGVDEPLDVLSVQSGLYGGMEFGGIGIDLYAGGGFDDFEANRAVNIGSYSATAKGDWSGYHYNASVTAGRDFKVGNKYYIRPSASISYLNMNENAFEETGTTDVILAIDKRQTDIGTATAMLEVGGKFLGSKNWFTPSIRAGYRNDFIGDDVMTIGRFVNGSTPFALPAGDFPESGFLLGLSFASGSEYASFSFDYDTDIRSGFIRHTARVVLRMIF